MPGFEDFLSHLFGGGDHVHPESLSHNPADYPHAVEVTDGEAIMAIETMHANQQRQHELMEQIRVLVEDLNIARAERQIMDTRFWRAMREKHPVALSADSCGMGYRKFDGKYYLVSWGGSAAHNSQSTGGDGGETGQTKSS